MTWDRPVLELAHTASYGVARANAADIVGGDEPPFTCGADYAQLNNVSSPLNNISFTRHAAMCVYQHSIAKHTGKTVAECKKLCRPVKGPTPPRF